MRQEGRFPWLAAIPLWPIVLITFPILYPINADPNWGNGWQKGIPQSFCIDDAHRAYTDGNQGPDFCESFTH